MPFGAAVEKMVDDGWNIKVLTGLVMDSEDCGRAEEVPFFTLSFCHLARRFWNQV